MTKKRAIWIIAAALVAAAVLFSLRTRPILVEVESPQRMTVYEFIAEDAETQLAKTYTVDIPVSGTLERVSLNIGEHVMQGDVIARVDPFIFEEQLRAMEASIAQVRSQSASVDTSKPKPELLDQARQRIGEAEAAREMAVKARTIAEINCDEARRNFARAETLHKQGVLSQREYDQANSTLQAMEQELDRARVAEQAAQRGVEIAGLGSRALSSSVDDNEFMRDVYAAQIASLESQLSILKSELDKTVIHAPVSGPVLMKFVEDRRTLPAGTPILTLGDLASSEMVCDVLSEEVVRVREGNAVEISGKALNGAQVAARVKQIYPAAFKKISSLGIEQQRVRVLMEYDAASLELRPGTSLDARIITAESADTLAVPERALFQTGGGWHVFTTKSGRARLTPVKVGLKNDSWAEILDGLGADSQIIVEPPNDLTDGARVSLKR